MGADRRAAEDDRGQHSLRRSKHTSPRLALTSSTLEVVFFELYERHEVPLPMIVVVVEGFLVDAFWPAHRLVVEVDGGQAHGTPARVHVTAGTNWR